MQQSASVAPQNRTAHPTEWGLGARRHRVASCLTTAAFVLATGLASGSARAAVCKAQAYGAKPDGVTINTAALQKAIDACAEKGGGTVRLSGGTFLSAPLVLKSHIDLEIEKGATLLGSANHDDYPSKTEFREPGRQSLLSAKDAEDIAITGGGTIDGNGSGWWVLARAQKDHGVMGQVVFRPRLIVFDHCKHVRIEGVTVQNSPSWQIVPYYSDDVTIRNIKVLAPQHSPNTDAIDPFSSSHVRIEHVLADVGDDNVAIKSGAINSPGPDRPSTDITISDCTFLHGHGLSIGSEIAGGAQNVTATNIHFEGTDQGIRVKANRDRGNDVSHLVFRNLTMKDVRTAILISEYYPKVLPPPDEKAQPVTRLTPHFHDILIENVQATASKVAGVIVGLPEAPVKNVVLRNVSIDAQKGMTIAHAEVTGTRVTIHAASGDAIVKGPGAEVVLR